MRLSDVWLSSVLTCLLVASAPAASRQLPAPDWPPRPPQIEVQRLENGIRLIQISASTLPFSSDEFPGSLVRVSFGYTVDGAGPADGHAARATAVSWLLESVPTRTLELVAHLAGGRFEVASDVDLVGLRLEVPRALLDAVIEQAALFLDQTLVEGELLDYILDQEGSLQTTDPPDATAEAVNRVRTALLGPGEEDTSILSQPEGGSVQEEARRYFRDRFGTDRAWVVVSQPLSGEQVARLNAIGLRHAGAARRISEGPPVVPVQEITLPSDREGGVVIGSRISSVYYESWFDALLVDRALRVVVDPDTRLAFRPAVNDSVHLIQREVPYPEYPRVVAGSILSQVSALVSEGTDVGSLPEIKQEAMAYLASRGILEWFAAKDLWQQLEDGWGHVWNLTEEEFRVSVASFLGAPRVAALWAPAFDAPSVEVGELGVPLDSDVVLPSPQIAPGRIEWPALGELPQVGRSSVKVECLESGVCLAAGLPSVFVAGPVELDLPGGRAETGPNGTLWRFDELPADEVFAALSEVRPDRLSVFLPSGELERGRRIFGQWAGGRTDATDSRGVGVIATRDLPSLVILKVWLDSRVIEAGWSREVRLRVAGPEGARIAVETDPARLVEIEQWLSEASVRFGTERGEREFAELREAAGAYFDEIRRDLEILLAQRAPGGEVPPPSTVSLRQFRSFLAVYF